MILWVKSCLQIFFTKSLQKNHFHKKSFIFSYTLAGIVSWGLGCENLNPGVYADITQSLCFIQWDTNCKHNDKYDEYFKIQGCDNWLEDEIAK